MSAPSLLAFIGAHWTGPDSGEGQGRAGQEPPAVACAHGKLPRDATPCGGPALQKGTWPMPCRAWVQLADLSHVLPTPQPPETPWALVPAGTDPRCLCPSWEGQVETRGCRDPANRRWDQCPYPPGAPDLSWQGSRPTCSHLGQANITSRPLLVAPSPSLSSCHCWPMPPVPPSLAAAQPSVIHRLLQLLLPTPNSFLLPQAVVPTLPGKV